MQSKDTQQQNISEGSGINESPLSQEAKYPGVYLYHSDDMAFRALRQSMNLFGESFMNLPKLPSGQELINLIQSGQCKGIINLNNSSFSSNRGDGNQEIFGQDGKSNFQSIFVHQFSGDERHGKNGVQNKINRGELVLPEVLNLKFNVNSIVVDAVSNNARINEICSQMVQGEYKESELSPKTLEQAIAEIKPLMVIPNKQIKVWIIDDESEKVLDILSILRAWKNLRPMIMEPNFIFENSLNTTNFQNSGLDLISIFLLDEDLGIDLGGTKGQDLYNNLLQVSRQSNSHTPKFISISSGQKPEWANSHYPNKGRELYGDNAKTLVETINKAIEQLNSKNPRI